MTGLCGADVGWGDGAWQAREVRVPSGNRFALNSSLSSRYLRARISASWRCTSFKSKESST
jgi:hypothetical protein